MDAVETGRRTRTMPSLQRTSARATVATATYRDLRAGFARRIASSEAVGPDLASATWPETLASVRVSVTSAPAAASPACGIERS